MSGLGTSSSNGGSGNGALVGQQLGKYEVLALLALGGTAEIYLARIGGASGFEKFVVIKCLHEHLAEDEDFVRMFLDEARLAAQLDHSNIVQTFELGQHDGRYYMAMEYLAGMSLAMMVKRVADRLPDHKLPIPLVLNIVQQACAGLHYAHERHSGGTPLNIVHRDISPQNVVVSYEGVAKLVDFGIARADVRETRTQAGTIKGKFAYMSPEQCVSGVVDRRSDIFAMGVVLYEMLVGHRLFKRANQYDTYQAVMDCVVPLPSSENPELDAGIDAVVMKALTKDREARYATAEAFGDAILRYLHERNIFAGPADVARFFDEHFASEIGDHGVRMRELMAGQEVSVTKLLPWDEEVSTRDKVGAVDDEITGAVAMPVPPMDSGSRNATSETRRLNAVAAANEDESTPPPQGEPLPDPTRIEMNPLDSRPSTEHSVSTVLRAQEPTQFEDILRPSATEIGKLPTHADDLDSASATTAIGRGELLRQQPVVPPPSPPVSAPAPRPTPLPLQPDETRPTPMVTGAFDAAPVAPQPTTLAPVDVDVAEDPDVRVFGTPALIGLFVAALVGALLLTIVVARGLVH